MNSRILCALRSFMCTQKLYVPYNSLYIYIYRKVDLELAVSMFEELVAEHSPA